MGAIFLTEETAEQLFKKLEVIEDAVKAISHNSKDAWLNNEEARKLLNVSKRCLQTWRDSGIIAFSQIGHKIYYHYADVEAMLQSHKNSSFR